MLRFKRIIALALAIVMISMGGMQNVNAAEMFDASPYAYIEKSYSSTVSCGTIRYVSQLNNKYFQEDYWGDYASGAYYECASACVSMALSYVGVNKFPGEMLEENNGTTYFSGWGPVTYDSRSDSSVTFEKAVSNYLNGKGKYSPPIVHLSKGHYILIAGVTSDGNYISVDPGTVRVSDEYTEADLTSQMTGRIVQYYNPSAGFDNNQHLESITLSAEYVEATAGDIVTLDLIGEPFDVDNTEATWLSSNRSVARVSADGTVTTLGAGTTVISATLAGKTAQCTVTVKKGASYENTFTDVEDNMWYYDEVDFISSNGIMTGTSSTTFEPGGKVTRGAFAVTLHRLSGAEDMEYEAVFSDVYDDTWYTDAVLWAANYGVVNGYADNTFRATDNISRQQMVTMLYRYAGTFGYDINVSDEVTLAEYTDAGEVSTYAQDAMKWAVGNGILTGKSATVLDPTGEATRAECATIIMRLMQYI